MNKAILLFTLAILLICSTASAVSNDHQTSSATFICCPEGYVFDDDTLSCVCPKDKPFINVAGQCVACPAPSGWNQLTKTCIRCISPATYNPKTASCECPKERPHLAADGSCVSCPAPKFWNCKTQKCTSCPSNLEFNFELRRCVCP
jgi:hypothetical protein